MVTAESTSKNRIEYIKSLKNIKTIIYHVSKRVFDILLSIIGIVGLLPLTLFIWIANIFQKDFGPVFYTQERIGKNGKLFKLYKYRSMVVDADDKLSMYLAQDENARAEYKKYKKLQEDPRITKVGNVLRRYSLDEIPQFINILVGQMSIVGPRPYLPREKEDMGETYDLIIKVKPGLTGLWQVNGRSTTVFSDRLIMDRDYVLKKSFSLDVKIFLRTFIKVFGKEGAK